MSIVDFEIDEVRKLCENVVPHSKIIACTKDPALLRVDIQSNQYYRQFTVCLRFPSEYPKQSVLIELKSKTLSEKFLQGLTGLCERQVKQEYLGKPHCIKVLQFLQQYVNDNPLCVCFDEIQQLRKDLGEDASTDQLKLKQKSSCVHFTVKGGEYYYRVKAVIPDDYPLHCVDLQQQETNLPAVLLRYLNGQSREIARQCVEPPLRMPKGKTAADFQPAPSLYRTLKFCLEATKGFHLEECPICGKLVLPQTPAELEADDNKDAFVERVYCGHLFHQGCLKLYLSEPPFPKGGKLCPAKSRHLRTDATYYMGGGMQGSKIPTILPDKGGACGIRLAHDRWVVNVKMAESRWAQKQARQRELEEVVDFLK
uniref:RWD domain-containing protein n=1 Tax=Stomoxys calcitrans TaxID=35570 RepID=A0A1I8PMX0_STOCA